jgi:hypothetical protein
MALSSEQIAAIRQDYADRVPVAQICAKHQVSQGTAYYWIDGGPRDPARRLPPIPRRCGKGQQRNAPRGQTTDSRVALMARLWRAAEQQVRDIEQRLKAIGQVPSERERDARALAVLVKTLRELAAFDAARGAAQSTEPADDDAPRDMDEFRRELARKIDAIIAERNQ